MGTKYTVEPDEDRNDVVCADCGALMADHDHTATGRSICPTDE